MGGGALLQTRGPQHRHVLGNMGIVGKNMEATIVYQGYTGNMALNMLSTPMYEGLSYRDCLKMPRVVGNPRIGVSYHLFS